MTSPLTTFLARTGVATSNEVLGIDLDRWRDAVLDLAFLEEIHRAVVGDRESVRRILADGSSILAPAQPGHVRTKPQAFRAGEHVERAWEQGELRSGLVKLCRAVAPFAGNEPVRAAAQLVWTLSRAQPFTGMNERVALVLASWVLRQAGLNVLNIERVERDAAFESALVTTDGSALERYFMDAVWDEALVVVESHVPAPPASVQRWTLADEYKAATHARAHAHKLSPQSLSVVVDHLSTLIEREAPAKLGVSLEPAHREWLESHSARQACAWGAAIRGRRISPHEQMLVARWTIANAHGLELKLVVGAAGRGMTGASGAHLALEVADQPVAGPVLGTLLVPEQNETARQARMSGWLERAIARAVELSPLRL